MGVVSENAGLLEMFASVPGGIHKIGYALDPEQRMKELERRGARGAARCRFGLSWTDEVEPWQSEACKPYYLLWSAPADDHRTAERTLHRHFAHNRIRIESWPQCEWFTLDADDIAYILSIERFEGDTAIRTVAQEPKSP